MKKALERYAVHLAAVVMFIVLALAVGGFILTKQRLYLPAWVPVIGTDFYNISAEFETAQAVMPGQGQTVNIAGVPIGEIGKVTLDNGVAVIDMKIRRKYAPVHKDANILLRPKTALNDMFLELDRGHPRSGDIPEGGRIPLGQTKANVSFDEILSVLDVETRDYLQQLFNGAGEGLDKNGKTLAAVFRRFEPTARDGKKAGVLVAKRHKNIARSIHNLGLLTRELGDNQQLVSEFIQSSNVTFAAFASESASIQSFIQKAPGALGATADAIHETRVATADAGPAFEKLQPFAKNFGSAMVALRPFFKDQTALTKNKFRPFAVQAQPFLGVLAPASKDLDELTPNATAALKSFNVLLNTVGYNPPGESEGYISWLAWFSHLNASLFNSADAHGFVRSGTNMVTCRDRKAAYSIANQGVPASEPFQLLLNLTQVPQPSGC
ncbi:MAG: MCE family protein [Thermoleophilaceae bacterium]|nr:MCE family protein [Thermoleophilaceae bacterium]